MHYTKFQFRNFKGLRDVSLRLGPDASKSSIVTLVGLNESGKTTLLEAIDRFVPGKVDEEIRPKDLLGVKQDDPFDLIPIAHRGNFNEPIEIKATVHLNDEDKRIIADAVQEETGFRVSNLPDEVAITNRYSYANSEPIGSKTLWPGELGEGQTKQGKIVHAITSRGRRTDWEAVVGQIRRLVPKIWYFPNFLFEFPERVRLDVTPSESDANRLFRTLLEDIIRSIDQDATLEEHVVKRALSEESSAKASLKQIRLQIGAEVTSTVVARWNEMFGGNELQGKRIFFDVEQEGPKRTAVYGQFMLEDGNELFSIGERSLGFRWFFVYLLLTTYRARRPAHGGIVYLLDEPASNLHSSAQRLLLESLQNLGDHAQVIYTTHSHHLIKPAWLESTFVVANEAADPSKITTSVIAKETDIHVTRYPEFAYQNPGKQHYFQPVLDVLAYRPTDLELVPEVVMTEGKSDYYLIQYYLSVISTQQARLNVLPGRGAGSLDEVIRLYTGWGRNFVILLDTDQGGGDAAKHYQREFGRTVSGRVLDLSSISGVTNAKGIETLLEVPDRLAFQRLIDPTADKWNKRMWAQGVEHALATMCSLNLSDKSVARLEKATKALAAELAARRSGVAEPVAAAD